MAKFKSTRLVKITYAAIAFGVIVLGVLVASDDGLSRTEIALAAVSTVFSTFLGATFAYRLQQYRDDQSRRAERVAALNRGLFVLIQQLNALVQIAGPFKRLASIEQRAFGVDPYRPPDYSRLRQDLDSLNFLIECGQPQALLELAVEDDRFFQALVSVEIRTTHLVPLIERIHMEGLEGRTLTRQAMDAALGELNVRTMLAMTVHVCTNVFGSLDSLPTMFDKLRGAAKAIYPAESFLKMESKTESN